ncbi:helix-turn-helix domain-containing protein [Streptomyces sp. NPDC056161]|uniref:helix-turn-helix domain-containing protein n=1 Tax=Streptomyces sp. NPDC056161 TaxID=3345732 RepID=UPI0035E01DE2
MTWPLPTARTTDARVEHHEQRGRREEVRMRAVDLFEEDVEVPCIARELRVSEKSVHQWRRAWLLHRMGYSVQIPARPAAERDEEA